MATIDLCPETTSWLWAASTASSADNDESVESPRISFSQSDGEGQTSPPRLDGSLLLASPTSEFDFCVAAGVSHYDPPASAAELFSNGKLLPLAAASANRINPFAATTRWVFPPLATEQASPPSRPPPPVQPPECAVEAGEKLKEILARHEDDDSDESSNPAAVPARQSFWRFGRSKSLKVGESAAAASSHKTGLLRSFQLLPRSKSTGSNPNNPALLPNASNGKLQRQPSLNGGKKARPAAAPARKQPSPIPKALARSVSCSATFYHHQPLSSSASTQPAVPSSYYYGSRSSNSSAAVKIRPVLNIPTPNVLPRTGSSSGGSGFSGIGFLLCNWKKTPQEL